MTHHAQIPKCSKHGTLLRADGKCPTCMVKDLNRGAWKRKVTAWFNRLFTPKVDSLETTGDEGGLIHALEHHKDWHVQRDAAKALGRIGTDRAVDCLIGALQHSNSKVRRSAVETLRAITGKDFPGDPDKWRKWRGERNGQGAPAQSEAAIIKQAFVFSMEMIQSLKENRPVFYTPNRLGIHLREEYHDRSLIPIVAIVDEGWEADPEGLCASLISGIPEIQLYKNTKVVYHRLSRAFSTIISTNQGGEMGPIGIVLAHSNVVPKATIEGTEVESSAHHLWEKTVAGGRKCYIYECVLRKTV